MTLPKAVVFDIGNVLVEWEPALLYARLLPDPVARAALFGRVDFDAMNAAGDREGGLQAKVAALAARHPEDAAAIRAWWEHWHVMFAPDIPDSIAMLRNLRADGVPVFALSNFADDSFERAMAQYPVLAEFDIPVISGREGVMKPEPRIYEILEERSGLSGADLFFTDDRADNIAAAEARGWRAHLFEGPAGLRAALAAAGFSVA
jgi:2-haloacid dehalogenase